MQLFKSERSLARWDGMSDMNLVIVILKHQRLLSLTYYQLVKKKFLGMLLYLILESLIMVEELLIVGIVYAF